MDHDDIKELIGKLNRWTPDDIHFEPTDMAFNERVRLSDKAIEVSFSEPFVEDRMISVKQASMLERIIGSTFQHGRRQARHDDF